MNEALAISDLRVSIDGAPLVDGVSVTVRAGEAVALLGHSGSGKSLTAAAITGNVSPQLDVSGSLALDGRHIDIRTVRRPEGAVACVQQDSSRALNPLIRVGSQLEVPLRGRGMSAAGAREKAASLLAGCGIEDPARALRSYPAELSGGQRQRVCIALALACEARLLIADEPTTALDVVSQSQVIQTLADAQRGGAFALLFITHDIAVASQVAERAIVLYHGRIVEEGPFHEIVTRPRHPYTRALVDAVTASSESVPA